MQTIAFTMQLLPGVAAEYQRRHDTIWPELSAALLAAGIRDYFIFVDEASGRLFAVQSRQPGHTADALAALPLMRRWWDYMADLMQVNSDNSPVVQPLQQVFHLQEDAL